MTESLTLSSSDFSVRIDVAYDRRVNSELDALEEAEKTLRREIIRRVAATRSDGHAA